MSDLQKNLQELGTEYRKIFYSTVIEISDLIESHRPAEFTGDISAHYENGSVGYNWQKEVKKLLEEKLQKETSETTAKLQKIRANYQCSGCGVCCKFAVSEFSPEELKLKSENGDKLAIEFINTFVPYQSAETARRIYPEYVELLEKNTDGKYYIYHCPKVMADNKCPDYENRPQICRDFPDNPIGFLPKTCGYTGWKSKAVHLQLKLTVLSEVVKFYLKYIPPLGFLD